MSEGEQIKTTTTTFRVKGCGCLYATLIVLALAACFIVYHWR